MTVQTSAGRLNPKLLNAVTQIVRAVLSKEIAATVGDPLKSQIIKRAEETIAFIIDDYCGTRGHSMTPPWPMPGPRGPALDLAIALAGFANITAQPGTLRTEIMKIAGHLTQTAYANDGLT
jgi:hypothetical protein